MQHPHNTVPGEVLPSAYADLLVVLARDEPDALRRAAATVEDQVGTAKQPSPASQLARAWLSFTGNAQPTVVPDGGVFHFRFPATLAFEVVLPGGGVAAAQTVARRALAALDASDTPVGAIEGPLPGAPALVNLSVWAGSTHRKGDRLELELTDVDLPD